MKNKQSINRKAALLVLMAALQFNATVPADDESSPAVVDQTTFRPVFPSEPTSAFAVDEKLKPVKVSIFPSYSKLPRGGNCYVAVELKIEKGWHINSNPASPDFLVPTTLEVKTDQKIKLTKVKYPPSHKLNVKGSPDPYFVYDGKATVYGLLEIDDAETGDVAEMEFHIGFQGCNVDQCLPPDKIIMKGKLKIAAAGEVPRKINEDKFPKPKVKRAAKSGAIINE